MIAHTGVALINLGTPDSPEVPDVRKYLREFLSDPRVIDISDLGRFLLVNLIIAPFRSPKSSKVYKKLWTENGSPLLYYGKQVQKMLQDGLGQEYIVTLGMRYQSPSIAEAMEPLLNKGLKRIIVLPLFPQYASATTGSVHEAVMKYVSGKQVIPDIKFISTYFDNSLFIKAFAGLASKYMEQEKFDHVLFSYHGLPERQIGKADYSGVCSFGECCNQISEKNYYCYRAQCFATTRLIADELNLKQNEYSTCFQSRLGRDPWIQPYAEEVIKGLPAQGKKKVLVLVPSFVADCLETTIEVGEEYKHLFLENGGEKWQMVESLNDSPQWIEVLKNLIVD